MASGPADYAFSHLPTDLPVECDGHGVWRAVLDDAMIQAGVERVPGAAFYADLSLLNIPGLKICTGDVSANVTSRARENVLSDGNDDICMDINLQGRVSSLTLGDELEREAGIATLFTAGDPYALSRGEPGRILAFRVPRPALAALVPNVEDALGRPVGAGTPQLRLLTRYIESLAEEGSMGAPELRHMVTHHVYDLMALTIGARGDAAAQARERGLAAARLAALKDDIIANLADPGISATAMAGRHRMTPRNLHRLFESEGTTFTSFVLGRRLAQAHRLLGDPRMARRHIATVVYDCGFSDVSYFNRAFRRLYGATPSDVRAAGRAAGPDA